MIAAMVFAAGAARCAEDAGSKLSRVPRPVLDDHADWLELYDAAWKIAFDHVKSPEPGSGLVAEFMDEAFSSWIFQWDTAFMVMFARYGNGEVPVGGSFDNFYAFQHDDGFICRQISEEDGRGRFGRDEADAINPPLFSWVEWQVYRMHGDAERVRRVLPVLVKYFDWIKQNRRRESGLYYVSNWGSGMDNSPRCPTKGWSAHDDYDYTWIDMSAQQALNALYVSRLAGAVGETGLAERFAREHAELSDLINRLMWSGKARFYYDLDEKGRFSRVKTIATFWTLIAEVTTQRHADALVKHIKNEKEFWRPHPVPTLARNNIYYANEGGYWRGSIWAPTEYMTVKGLDRFGYRDLAREIVGLHLDNMYTVLKDTGTIWENYAPEMPAPGDPSKGDFVGWSGVGPIAMLIEDIIGIDADGVDGVVRWRLRETGRNGVRGLKFGNHEVSLVADKRAAADAPARIEYEAAGPFALEVDINGKVERFELKEGRGVIEAGK